MVGGGSAGLSYRCFCLVAVKMVTSLYAERRPHIAHPNSQIVA